MPRLADEISKFTNPLPKFEDPEDLNDQTAAKVLSHGGDDDEDDEVSDELRFNRSKLRSHVAALQLEEDVKYSGKRVSRRSVMQDDDGDDGDYSAGDDGDDDKSLEGFEYEDSSEDKNNDSEGDDGDDDMIISDDEDEHLAGFKEKLKYHEKSQYTEQDDHTSDESESNDDDDDDDSDDDEANDEDEDSKDNLQTFTKVNVEEEIQKGKAVRAQLAIWDSLLEGRIRLQKALLIVNQLPQPDMWDQFIDAAGPEYNSSLAESGECLMKLLEQLVELQTALLLQNPDTKQLVESGEQSRVKSSQLAISDEEDEEITSDEENEDAKCHQPQPAARNLKRKLKEGQYPDFLAKRYKDFQHFRNSTIQKWYDKTRVASGRLSKGFTAFDQSALKQIEQILSDKERLVKRTQLKRSAYKVLGKPEPEKPKEDNEENADKNQLPVRDHLSNYDEEIFDDDDFYHQQLRELIERKTADINDPVALTRQWLEIQKLRNKKKKVVDTKASKGRKIRYDVHKKLVNFMAPYDNMKWTDEAKDELFGSLFGKKQTQEMELPTR